MFLYAKVVLENLLEQGSVADLESEINESFPEGLEEASVYPHFLFKALN